MKNWWGKRLNMLINLKVGKKEQQSLGEDMKKGKEGLEKLDDKREQKRESGD